MCFCQSRECIDRLLTSRIVGVFFKIKKRDPDELCFDKKENSGKKKMMTVSEVFLMNGTKIIWI